MWLDFIVGNPLLPDGRLYSGSCYPLPLEWFRADGNRS